MQIEDFSSGKWQIASAPGEGTRPTVRCINFLFWETKDNFPSLKNGRKSATLKDPKYSRICRLKVCTTNGFLLVVQT